MSINDADFNLFYSIKSFASIIFPFIIALALDKVGLKLMLVVLSICCAAGQWFFILGLTHKESDLLLARPLLHRLVRRDYHSLNDNHVHLVPNIAAAPRLWSDDLPC